MTFCMFRIVFVDRCNHFKVFFNLNQRMSEIDEFTRSDDIVQILVEQMDTNRPSRKRLRLSSKQNPSPSSDSSDEDITKSTNPKTPTTDKSVDFYNVVIPSYTPSEFRSFFRMSRACSARMMEKLATKVKIHNMEKKFLFTVWMLSTRESFCAVGSRFGLTKGVAYQYFCEIIDGLITLFKEYVSWPPESEFSHIEQGFKPKTGAYVPGIVGAIEGCHIQIKKPSRYSIYRNPRGTHSIILQAVCDHQMIFTDVYVGAPGCLSPERVFYNSPLSKEIESLIPEDYHIVGNEYYPALRNMVVPFEGDADLTETQMLFNDCLRQATAIVKKALRLLLMRFHRLSYLDTSKPELANKMVCSCIILHNHILMSDPEEDSEQLLQEEPQIEMFTNASDELASVEGDEYNGTSKRNYLLSLFEFI